MKDAPIVDFSVSPALADFHAGVGPGDPKRQARWIRAAVITGEETSVQIHSIDLHYHAGQERQEGVCLDDYLAHARITGRRVLGVTDHLQFYIGNQPIPPAKSQRFAYERSIAGLAHYRQELDALRPRFEDLELYFAPEVPPKLALGEIPEAVLELSDFFICECHFSTSIDAHTQHVVSRLEEMSRFTAATGKPTFLAHPFRNAVNHRLVKREIEPWVTAIAPRPDRAFPVEQVNAFYLLDVDAVGEAAARFDVPLEVNGGTQQRVRASNLPAALQMLWRAYERFIAHGATLVPGSDQHGFKQGVGRMGGFVPFDCFEALGLGVESIEFLPRLRAQAAAPAG